MNKKQIIYQYIRKNKSVSKQDIVVGLQFSLPTITQKLQALQQMRLIDTSQKIQNTGGRNATAYSYAEQARAAIGVYLTGHHMNCVAVDLSGNVIAMVKERVTFDVKEEAYLKKLGDVVEFIKKEANIADENLLGVGIAVQGLVSEDGEKVTYGRTLGFTGETREHIAKYIPYRNRLFHDSSAAGYAEVWINHEICNAFYLSLSNSVGGAVIIDNKVYEGNTLKSGEIGHMTVVTRDGKLCYCGRRGCFDTVCQSTILDQYTDGNLEQFFQTLKGKDPEAEKLWDEYLDNLSMGIHNARMFFDSDIIIGGYVGAYIEDYMEDLCERVNQRDPFEDDAKDYLVACTYKVESAAAGAAICFIDEFFDTI